MLHTKWDDPCGVGKAEEPLIVLPETGSSDMSRIRKQQSVIIPALDKLRKAGEKILKRENSIVQSHAQTDLLVEFIFRFPDQPDVVNKYIEQIPAHVVALSANDKLLAAENLVPSLSPKDVVQTHKIQRIVTPDGRVLDGESMRVIFPELFQRVTHWIKEIEGAICDVKYAVPTNTVVALPKLTKRQRKNASLEGQAPN